MRRRSIHLAAAVALATAGGSAAADGREASASLGIAINQGNTESERYNLNADYLERTNAHRFTANLELNRGKDGDGDEDVNNSRIGAGYDWFFHGPWYANSNLSWRQDRKADLRQRYVAGIGAGYQFFDDDRIRLSAEAGPTYISEEKLDSGDRNREAAARWALDYRQYFMEGALRFFHRHELISELSDSDEWFVTSRTGLRMPLMENLSASLQLNYDYDNNTEADSRYDATTLVNLTYDW
ncbi:DUF481 domain-containing protein [Halorhodospira sp. 9621]|uniref:DUF481 domain-containing protein n=1 Tax=Halorhodospira TaxID=85108 RepID=UPI001EE7AA17|nr:MULTISPECIES: DUF481 domain-containing protein [Halorhodospira]MCG5528526.1 DUF481 domain-containing protein [Halorhodospira halophila]MCG5533830.1 DUF481 domain-containing protein [Halorhodospira sp. 9621]MCG5543811.1 DUF481 domain-containing protein [Halorhodospira sp. 9628]